MDLEIITLNKVSQKEKRQVSYDLTYRWNLKYDKNQLTQEIKADSQTLRTDL